MHLSTPQLGWCCKKNSFLSFACCVAILWLVWHVEAASTFASPHYAIDSAITPPLAATSYGDSLHQPAIRDPILVFDFFQLLPARVQAQASMIKLLSSFPN